MQIDPAFSAYFNGKLRQVFLYITNVCGLRCEHCLYKTSLNIQEMELDATLNLIELFRSYGAEKLTFLGGEPTLYGLRKRNQPLFRVIERAFELGYAYIRLDTNGQSKTSILNHRSFKRIGNLSFSLDGHNAETNDWLRGYGTYSRCVGMLSQAVSLGYYVSVTTCVHPRNLYHLDEVIDHVSHLGAREINFHPMFKMGIPRDEFTGETSITPDQWVIEYHRLSTNIHLDKYKIAVRIPQRFMSNEAFNHSPDSLSYCPVRMGERVLVHPNGEMRICALSIGSHLSIANYTRDRIVFCGDQGEASEERLNRRSCMNQTLDFGDLVPLCISYKPLQHEYVWTTQEFDRRFGKAAD